MGIIGNRTLQSWAAFAVGLAIIWLLKIETDNALAWCLLAIVMLLEYLSFEHGVRVGAAAYRSLTPAEKREVDKIMDEEGT